MSKTITIKISVVIAASIFLLGITWYFSRNLSEKNDVLKSEILQLDTRLTLLKLKNSNYAKLKEDIETAQQKLELYNVKFPHHIEQEDTILKIHQMEKDSDCIVNKMQYQKLQLDILNQEPPPPKDDSKNSSSTGSNATLEPEAGYGMKMPAKIDFVSTYEEVRKYLELVANSEQKIAMREISIRVDKEQVVYNSNGTIRRYDDTDKTNCSVLVEFYGFIPEE